MVRELQNFEGKKKITAFVYRGHTANGTYFCKNKIRMNHHWCHFVMLIFLTLPMMIIISSHYG